MTARTAEARTETEAKASAAAVAWQRFASHPSRYGCEGWGTRLFLQPQQQIPPLRCGMTTKEQARTQQKGQATTQPKEQATTQQRTGNDTETIRDDETIDGGQ
jgi:hypothetical protein